MDRALMNRLKRKGMTEEGFESIRMYFRENKALQTLRKKRKANELETGLTQ